MKVKKKLGRPPRAGTAAGVLAGVRMTVQERAAIQKRARAAGLPFSVYIRERALGKAAKAKGGK